MSVRIRIHLICVHLLFCAVFLTFHSLEPGTWKALYQMLQNFHLYQIFKILGTFLKHLFFSTICIHQKHIHESRHWMFRRLSQTIMALILFMLKMSMLKQNFGGLVSKNWCFLLSTSSVAWFTNFDILNFLAFYASIQHDNLPRKKGCLFSFVQLGGTCRNLKLFDKPLHIRIKQILYRVYCHNTYMAP